VAPVQPTMRGRLKWSRGTATCAQHALRITCQGA